MGRPRMILLIRHAQSEGNKNRDIHQYVPDHRVKLTQEGWTQAEDAGRRLRSMLKPDDSLQFYTSPYRRTRETTEAILRTLTSDDPVQGPSPFARHKIKVYEEPRLREQDFGNFQPCSAEMERMWQERADYGHFFYRIPNGESAADAYDRVSGFNESLWRQFGEPDFPSVCVLVTHGLMTRVFLMKWYHWSIEYFEDLRNVNHCEFIVMKQNADNAKYVLQNQLRTWSDLKRRAALATGTKAHTSTSSSNHDAVPSRRWGGCPQGCDHSKFHFHRKTRRQNTQDYMQQPVTPQTPNETDDHPFAPQEEDRAVGANSGARSRKRTLPSKTLSNGKTAVVDDEGGSRMELVASPSAPTGSARTAFVALITQGIEEGAEGAPEEAVSATGLTQKAEMLRDVATTTCDHQRLRPQIPYHSDPMFLARGRDAGGSRSGVASPNDGSDDSDYFDTTIHQLAARLSVTTGSSVPRRPSARSHLSQIGDGDEVLPLANAEGSTGLLEGQPSSKSGARAPSAGRNVGRKERSASIKTEKEWAEESGMTGETKADALGDMDDEPDALEQMTEDDVERMKDNDRKGFGEIY